MFLTVLLVFGAAPLAGFLGLELPTLNLFAIQADAASYSGTCGDNLTWSLDTDTGVLVISGSGSMTEWDISTSVPWYSYRSYIRTVVISSGISSIGRLAFYSCANLENITIPKSVTSIGELSFDGCSSLANINIPSSVTSIENYTFRGCSSLTEITIPNSVKSIGNWAFDGCVGFTEIVIPNGVTSVGKSAFINCTNLKSVELPDTLITIGDYAFEECYELASITVPKNVASIGIGVFFYCPNLVSISVDSNNQNYSNDNYGVLFDKSKTILISYPLGNTRDCYNIPNSVTDIYHYAFTFCENLTSVTIPNSVTSIGDFAFGACKNLASIIIPDSIKSIGRYAFSGCSNLGSVVIPDSVTSIESYAFSDCGNLEYIHISSSVKSIGDYALNGSSAYICNETEACYAKTYCNENYKDFRVCLGHELPETPSIPDTPSAGNVYNLGEETYGFGNFGDDDSWFGHCFGMSMTSSAYYIGELDVNQTGISNVQNINGLTLTASVKEPICYYQPIQGSYSAEAIVAGGSFYLTSKYNIENDWNEVVNYVKNHNYDNKGSLQIGFRKNGEGGHAINFIRYEEVDGQPRIYAYDNNFPTVETYFYKDPNGKIQQAPYSTFSGAIDCIALRDVATYFSKVDDFDSTRYIYADRNEISVNGVEVYPLDGNTQKGERVVFEIPANVEQVTITPLVNNAEFTYLNEEYSFGNISNDSIGIFKLATSNDGSAQPPVMTVVNKSDITGVVIKSPSTTTISYGDSIILYADLTQTLPSDWLIKWESSNGNFDMRVSEDGTTCKISPNSSGDATFTATVYDADGNVISSDEQTMTSKAGFFDKIIAFFKSLFGLTKTIPQIYKGIM